MSKLQVDSIYAKDALNAPDFPVGATVTGVITATSFAGSGANLTNLPGQVDLWTKTAAGINTLSSVGLGTTNPVSDLTVGPVGTSGTSLLVHGDARVVGMVTATNLDITGSTVGLSWNASATNATADGAGLKIYGATNKTLLWQNDTGCFEFSDPIKVKGVTETVAAASTFMAGTQVVLELDVQAGTTFTQSMENITRNGGIGIVSFKNLPTDTGVKNGTTVTCIFTQKSTQANIAVGYNTMPQCGIGTSCIVSGWENGAKVAGIVTSALAGSATTVTLSETASDVDFVSFFLDYNGGSNTDIDSYKVYATKNGGFRQGNFQQ